MVRRTRYARGQTSLGAKLVMILTGVGLLGSLALTLLLAAIITPNFHRLETESVSAHVERTRAALGDFAAKVETAVRDYGDWNASYDYMAEPTRAFENESFSTLAMANLDISGMAYVAPDGRVLIARWVDPASGADRSELRDRLVAAVPGMRLPALLKERSSANFYLRLNDRLVAIGVAQVRRSDGTGEPRGHVLMARELPPPQLARLLQLPARLDLAHAIDATEITPARTTLEIAVPITGVDGKSIASARFELPRELSVLGRRMLLFAVGGAVMLMALVLLVLRRMIARLVLGPLQRVENHMGVVRRSGALTPLPEDRRQDEIGSLVSSFNSMLHQLKDLSEQVEVQSYKLGQSESAVAVMHNVRNALNPISTILSQGSAGNTSVDRAMLDRAVAELARDDIPAARRQKLAAFVVAANEAFAEERTTRARGMELGRSALRNVLEIIGRQQEQAHERPPLGLCDLSDIVAQNAAIARYSGAVAPAFVFPSKPHWALANRVILSQVIGNLFANAGEAIAARGAGGGAINVTIAEHGDRVELIIRDDGDGFDPREAPKFFQRGYSTRHEKSGGLGLHWCANSVQAMGGNLTLESDGPGTGARAILTLQAAPAERAPSELAA